MGDNEAVALGRRLARGRGNLRRLLRWRGPRHRPYLSTDLYDPQGILGRKLRTLARASVRLRPAPRKHLAVAAGAGGPPRLSSHGDERVPPPHRRPGGIYIILTSSLNVTNGYTGLFSFGHASFYGIGATIALPPLRLTGIFLALAVALRGYVLQTGRIVLADTAQNLVDHPMMRKAYLKLFPPPHPPLLLGSGYRAPTG